MYRALYLSRFRRQLDHLEISTVDARSHIRSSLARCVIIRQMQRTSSLGLYPHLQESTTVRMTFYEVFLDLERKLY
jgi:hypothetical protein